MGGRKKEKTSRMNFRDEKIWRVLTNVWTFLFLGFLLFNFFQKDSYSFLVAPLSVVYIGVLGLFVGTKEFDRWYDLHDGRHPGEYFVIAWTIIIFVLFCISFALKDQYHIPTEAITDYLVVLSVFALTQKSKRMHRERANRRS